MLRRETHHALILGAGVSGDGAARLLRAEGARVTLFDRALAPSAAAAFRALGVEARIAQPVDAFPLDIDLCVVSPGIPIEHPWIARARELSIPLVPEFELGWSRFRGRVAAITGTNGKSTMAKWMAESLCAAGLRAAPCGNYGPSVCRLVVEQPDLDWLVIEASSFQLETASNFRADIAILLNIAPNHLDRHPSMASYVAAKARLFARARGRDLCFAPAEWTARMRAEADGRGAWHTFGCAETDDYSWRDGRVRFRGDAILDLAGTYFDNPVLGPHAAAIAGAFHAAELPLAAASDAARVFEPLPHRMEAVVEARGIRFINDSKATTLAALCAGLEMAGRPVRLIAGGLLKETGLESVKEMLALRARGVYLIGKAAEKMQASWASAAPCVICGDLQTAVNNAWQDAQAGEAILLSPGCASFDQFANFEERGTTFRQIAHAISTEQGT